MTAPRPACPPLNLPEDLSCTGAASEGGRTAALVFKRPVGPSSWDALTVVLQPHGRGLRAAHVLRGASAGALHELDQVVRESTGKVPGKLDPAIALLAVARGVLVAQLHGHHVPAALDRALDLTGELRPAIAATEDLYLCACCSTPLSGGQQLALADGTYAFDDTPTARCGACEPNAHERVPRWLRPVPVAQARAEMAARAKAPRRALVFAARAESAGLPAAALAAARGQAHLMLGNPVQAAGLLRDAVAARPEDARLRALLVAAEASLGLVASATVHLDVLVRIDPTRAQDAARIRGALAGLAGEQPMRARAEEGRCLEALERLDSGDVDGARAALERVGEGAAWHLAAQVARGAVARGHGPTADRLWQDVSRHAGPDLSHAIDGLVGLG